MERSNHNLRYTEKERGTNQSLNQNDNELINSLQSKS